MDGDTKAPAGDDVSVRRYLRCAEQRSRYLIEASRARPMSRQNGHIVVVEAGIRDAGPRPCPWDGSPPLIGGEGGSPGVTIPPQSIPLLVMMMVNGQ